MCVCLHGGGGGSLKRLNIQSVAVYSEIDADAPFVKFADEAYCIGEATPSESYLNMDKILRYIFAHYILV